jgi:glutathione S-transferase
MLKLWGRANSSNVMKVIWLLEELGLPYERIDAGGAFGRTNTPEYRAMNPTGLVPTLQDGDFSLWESNAILRCICDAHAPGTTLWPQSPKARANIDRWMEFHHTLVRPQGVIFFGLVRSAPEQRDMAAIAEAAKEAARYWTILDSALAHHAYLAGDALSLADIVWGPNLHRWFFFAIERPEAPHLRAWYERLLQRPAYRQHVAVTPT